MHPPILLPDFDAADYDAMRADMVDGARLPATWEEWSQRTRDYSAALCASGVRLRRIPFDPAAFARWAEGREVAKDAFARTEWITREARRLDRAAAKAAARHRAAPGFARTPRGRAEAAAEVTAGPADVQSP